MRILLLILMTVLGLTACGPTRDDNVTQVDPEQSAREYMQVGNYSAAAEAYLELAENDKDNAAIYRLKATAAYVEAGNYDLAYQILRETSVANTDNLQRIRQKMLSARLNLEFSQPAQALSELAEIPQESIPLNMRYTYHDIQARAYEQQSEYMLAINQRLLASEHASINQQENDRLLLNILRDMPTDVLEANRFSANTKLASWLELGSIYHAYRFNPDRLEVAIDGWIQRYPGHPAFASIVPGIKEKSAAFVDQPNKIGLLLPFGNQFKKASLAIRDGILAAWYEDSRQDKSQIQIYDANALNINEVYQQAVADGMEYIIGPLEKEAVETLLSSDNLSVPVLALNRLDSLNENNSDKLIQFGLAPEDEAAQVAEVAKADGYSMALIITPDNSWGQRIADSFSQRWNEIGGIVLEQVYFSNQEKDFATPVKEILNIDSSEARIAAVRNKLNLKIHSEERRREDAEFIFVAAIPADARQLLPQVKFFRAGNVPVYSTSHIFTGVYDPTRDTDMNNVLFIDMPWVIDTRHQLSLIQDKLNNNLKQDKSSYRRLYAMGIDAYRLLPEINRLRLEQNRIYSGETGDLQLTEDNIIKRKLRRAQFVEGKPVLIN